MDRQVPYIGAGVGVAWNELAETIENGLVPDFPNFSVIDSFENQSFAWQVMAGFQVPLSQTLTLDCAFRATYLGQFQTGDSLTLTSNGQQQPLTPYDFDNNWVGSVYVALMWTPGRGGRRSCGDGYGGCY